MFPRLLMAWITTEVVRTKSRKIVLGNHLADFLRELDISREGRQIKALREQMLRLFTTAITCSYSDANHKGGVNMYPVEKYELWWGDTEWTAIRETEKELGRIWDSSITLSEIFFNEIISSVVVFSVAALKVLRKSPLAMDIYLWLTHKNSYSSQSTFITWEQLQLQFGAGYPTTTKGKLNFRQKFEAAWKKVTIVYPEAGKIKIYSDGLFFIPGRTHIRKTKDKDLPEKQ